MWHSVRLRLHCATLPIKRVLVECAVSVCVYPCIVYSKRENVSCAAYHHFNHVWKKECQGFVLFARDVDFGLSTAQTVCFGHYSCAEGFMRSCENDKQLFVLCVFVRIFYFGATNLCSINPVIAISIKHFIHIYWVQLWQRVIQSKIGNNSSFSGEDNWCFEILENGYLWWQSKVIQTWTTLNSYGKNRNAHILTNNSI